MFLKESEKDRSRGHGNSRFLHQVTKQENSFHPIFHGLPGTEGPRRTGHSTPNVVTRAEQKGRIHSLDPLAITFQRTFKSENKRYGALYLAWATHERLG